MSHFFFFFHRKIIKVVYTILAIAIKISLGNSNLFQGKNAIWFELLAQQKETGKHMADISTY